MRDKPNGHDGSNRWRKSSYSSPGNCVEVGRGAGIRDSKAPAKHLPLTAHQWARLLRHIKSA